MARKTSIFSLPNFALCPGDPKRRRNLIELICSWSRRAGSVNIPKTFGSIYSWMSEFC